MVGGGVGFGVSLYEAMFIIVLHKSNWFIISLDIINGINITSSTSTKCTVLSRTQDFLSNKQHWFESRSANV